MIVVETLCKNIAPSLYLSLSDCCHDNEERVFSLDSRCMRSQWAACCTVMPTPPSPPWRPSTSCWCPPQQSWLSGWPHLSLLLWSLLTSGLTEVPVTQPAILTPLERWDPCKCYCKYGYIRLTDDCTENLYTYFESHCFIASQLVDNLIYYILRILPVVFS